MRGLSPLTFKIQHVERDSTKTLPNLICGKFTVGGKDNLPPDIQALIMQNARIAMDQEKYQKEFDELVERHRQVKEKCEKQVLSSEQDVGRVAQIDYFISTLEKMEAPITEFDEQLWVSMVYHVVVHSKEDIRVVYRDGIEK